MFFDEQADNPGGLNLLYLLDGQGLAKPNQDVV
jgi:hypothetical protein